jgi:4-nitrophenyl phosphatase
MTTPYNLARNMLSSIKHLIIDMDGVLWHGDTPMPGLPDFFEGLRAMGIRFMLATNNASKSAGDFAAKLAHMGARVSLDEIMTSSIATATLLAAESPGARVGVVGEDGLKSELRARGLSVLEQERWADDAEIITVGIDRKLTYAKLVDACLAIRRGARFVATNPDVTFPGERGIVPGNGAIVAALRVSTGVEPRVVGKPMPDMMLQCMQIMRCTPATTAALGDRLDTDILGGQRAGLHTVMVTSGVNTRDDVARCDIKPDYIFDDITQVLIALRAALRAA